MSEIHADLNSSSDNQGSEPLPSLDSIKQRISDISQKPLSEHPDEYEAIHSDLQRVLSNIDGL